MHAAARRTSIPLQALSTEVARPEQVDASSGIGGATQDGSPPASLHEAGGDAATVNGERHASLYNARTGSHIQKLLAQSLERLKAPAAGQEHAWAQDTNRDLDIAMISEALGVEEPELSADVAAQCKRMIEDLLERDPLIVADEVRPYLQTLDQVIEKSAAPEPARGAGESPPVPAPPTEDPPPLDTPPAPGQAPSISTGSAQMTAHELAMERELLAFAGVKTDQPETGQTELKSRIREAARTFVRVCTELQNTPGVKLGFKLEDMAGEVRKRLEKIFAHDRRVRSFTGALDAGLVYSTVILLFSEVIIPRSPTLANLSPQMLGLTLSFVVSVPTEFLTRFLGKVQNNHMIAHPSRSDIEEIDRLYPMPGLLKTVASYVLLLAGLTALKNSSRIFVPLFLSSPMDRAVVGNIDTGLDTGGTFPVGAACAWLAYKILYGKAEKPQFLARPPGELESTMRQALDPAAGTPTGEWMANDLRTGGAEALKTFSSLAAWMNVAFISAMIPLLFYTKARITADHADPQLAQSQISTKETVLRAADSMLLMSILVGGAALNGIGIGATLDPVIRERFGRWMADLHSYLGGTNAAAPGQETPEDDTAPAIA